MITISVKDNTIKIIDINKNLTNSELYRKIWYEKYKIKLPKNEESSYDIIMNYLNNDVCKKEKNF